MECESWGQAFTQGVALYSGNGLSDSRWVKVAEGAPEKAGFALCHPSTGTEPPGTPALGIRPKSGQKILNNSWFTLQSTRGSSSRQTIPCAPKRIPSMAQPGTGHSQQAQNPRELTMLGRDSCCTVLFRLKASSSGHKRRCWLVHDDLPSKLLLL